MVKAAGYKNVDIDFEKKQAKVTYDPAKTDPKKLAAAINKATGYKVTVKS